MTSPGLETLLAAARGPLGPAVNVDLGAEEGPLGELVWMLGQCNGFFLYNASVQLFRAGSEGLGPELASWNYEDTWKDVHGRRAGELFCFAQDVFSVQFAVVDNAAVVTFDPETGEVTWVGESLEAWAQWLLAEPAGRTGGPLATAWQEENGPLEPDQRLMPYRPFVFGGSYELANLRAVNAVEAMRARGPIAQQLRLLPEGSRVSIMVR